MEIQLHVRKHHEDDWLQAVTGDWVTKRAAPWDPDAPDLRGFNLHASSEAELLERLPGALTQFLERLGFTVQGVTIERENIANFWPPIYVANASVSPRPTNDARRIPKSIRADTA